MKIKHYRPGGLVQQDICTEKLNNIFDMKKIIITITEKEGGNGMTLQESIDVLKELKRCGYGILSDKDKQAIDTIVSELGKPTYTPDDMQSFWIWAYNNGWYYGELTEAWYNSAQMDDTKHTIEEVLKLWEAKE